MSAELLFLAGMMGVGKSSVGPIVAERLRWGFVDTDDLVTERVGCSIAQLWAESGEAAFRVIEAEVVAAVIAGPGERVIALGGGVVNNASNRERIAAAGRVVWLRADVETLLERIGSDPGRPLLGGDALRALSALTIEREHLYRSLADQIVEVGGLSPSEIADEVVAELADHAIVVATP